MILYGNVEYSGLISIDPLDLKIISLSSITACANVVI
jgi:hypothetical protein